MDSPTLTEDQSPPSVTFLQDLTIVEAWDPETKKPKYVTFFLITDDERVFFGQSFKNKREITLEEYSSALEPVKDEEIYPEVPADVQLTIAPESWDDTSAFIKRPGLTSYEEMKGTEYNPRVVLEETLMMEQVSKNPRPNIVRYYGCHVRRGRITAILVERLDETLMEYVSTPGFQQLDRERFLRGVESAVDHLHSLGLAHNDISPHNIMVKDGMLVLIDFGSCQPFGHRLQSLGSDGWCEDIFFTSEKKHDEFSVNKLREWIQNPN